MRRGEIWSLKPPQDAIGHEQKGRRYALIVSSDAYQELSTVAAAPTSTRAPEALIHPTVEISGQKTQVLIDQVRSIDRSRLGRRIASVEAEEMAGVDSALKAFFGLF